MSTPRIFAERFDWTFPRRANFVGGGGKTALILRLAEELGASALVLYTTTTRMHPPPMAARRVFLACDRAELLARLLETVAVQCSSSIRTVAVTSARESPGLYRGVAPGFVAGLDPALFPIVLNEADGARSVSLKYPRETEPVPLEGANLLIPVVGLDCLGQPLGPATLFRWELARARFGLVAGDAITPELAARVLLDPDGVCRHWQPGVEIVPFINKVDREEDEPAARDLARRLIERRGRLPIRRVLWGSVERSRVGVVPC